MIAAICFALTAMLSACLLFFIQPLCAKMALPMLGGTPAVWNTCMLFFQIGLLAGYAAAHWGPRWLGVTGHGVLHLAGLAAALCLLPIGLSELSADTLHPVLWLLGSLTVAAGLPFFLLSATAPLLQKWYSWTGRDPYFLYAASNFGSFLALGIYPFLAEPNLSLGEQAEIWRWAFVPLVGMSLVCFLTMRPWHVSNGMERGRPAKAAAPTTWRQRWRWLLLALVPSSLLLSVTSHLTTDIAPIPLLWVLPLALYLLTFTLVFARRKLIPHIVAVRWLPLALLIQAFLFLSEATVPILLILGLHLAGFFWIALVCHGELARTRPPAEHLTEFYLWLALGGMLGGICNALLAPLVFPTLLEYPLMLAAAALLRPSLAELHGEPKPAPTWADWMWAGAVGIGTVLAIWLAPWLLARTTLPSENLRAGAMFAVPLLFFYALQERPIRAGLTLAAILLASTLAPGVHGQSSLRVRDFFGVHRVTEKNGRRMLVHGNTIHGVQIVGSTEPQGYYHKEGPFGQLWKRMGNDPRLSRVGLIGLGAGAMASYAKPHEKWTFFEIDPAVVYIARDSGLFTYLKEAKGDIDIVLGDGRASLRKRPEKFGLLVIDAFGSDSIPMHLLTREALRIYLDQLDENGILVFHISNRYLDLEPVLAKLAADARPPLVSYVAADESREHPSTWLVMTHASEEPALAKTYWRAARSRQGVGIWTDDFSNLLRVFRW